MKYTLLILTFVIVLGVGVYWYRLHSAVVKYGEAISYEDVNRSQVYSYPDFQLYYVNPSAAVPRNYNSIIFHVKSKLTDTTYKINSDLTFIIDNKTFQIVKTDISFKIEPVL